MGLFNSKNNNAPIECFINESLSEEEIIKKYHNIIREQMLYNEDIINFDAFVNYVYNVISNIKSKYIWYGKYTLLTNYDKRLISENLEHNKLMVDKLKLELEIKNYEIEKLKSKISNTEYRSKASLKRKNVTLINKEINKIPRKKRRLAVEHRKNMDNFHNAFFEKYPEYYKNFTNINKGLLV